MGETLETLKNPELLVPAREHHPLAWRGANRPEHDFGGRKPYYLIDKHCRVNPVKENWP
jgi:hypothetical protein